MKLHIVDRLQEHVSKGYLDKDNYGQEVLFLNEEEYKEYMDFLNASLGDRTNEGFLRIKFSNLNVLLNPKTAPLSFIGDDLEQDDFIEEYHKS